ncbi:unnamed protein product [Allacma fusca]|uniref:Riboflavin kinase domain-containing protein n=1 Tax=Allacma fusca TaxID=39272 RepID=A0A8J2KS67_9HEXA|nr:unnamed protein product [Allacma fusca]
MSARVVLPTRLTGRFLLLSHNFCSPTTKPYKYTRMSTTLPHFASGEVVKGFGRGSKTLGTPTANLEQCVVDKLPADFKTGIYFGWAQVNDGPVYEQVTSIGWNPYFRNQTKSMETHVIHSFTEDFYGSNLKVILVGYIRDEMDFKGLEELKAAIANDIEVSKQELLRPEFRKYKTDEFFCQNPESLNNGKMNGNA